MPIKAVVVDMDGTFLNSKSEYDQANFKRLLERLKQEEIRFIVNSGNQYYRLRDYFPDTYQDITFISDNGAIVFDHDERIQVHTLSNTTVLEVLSFLREEGLLEDTVLSGEKSAYVLTSDQTDAKAYFINYYSKIDEVKDFKTLPKDTFLKLSLRPIQKDYDELFRSITEQFGDILVPVSSGNGNVDIIQKDFNKGTALRDLLDYFDISSEDTVAFGDGGNDVEMLEVAGQSYAMENSEEQALKAAKFIAPSNDKDGVITTVFNLLDQKD